jgi:tRNA A37 threonylcarbamoyladenosine dehydratase
MKIKLENLQQRGELMSNIYAPVFYRLSNNTDKKKLNELLQTTPNITVFDELLGQLEELVKLRNPKTKFSKNELTDTIKKHVGKTPFEEYGVWVYYTWANRLVHLLDEQEFVDVRTSRNQNKITKDERDILAKKKIGVIGLSVGQSVSVTLAMERICGELRLADFDVLELTNLNRIRTGVHNLGVLKVYSVAREIAEIDPFIKVVCYPEGLTESNMDDFFIRGGKLDLLIEESDGFDIKILSRYKARELQIPVLMEASDRCMVDVERFDLEPNRDILHGLVNHLNVDILKSLKTNEDKIPYMLDVLGLETSSVRLKASMLEIEQTINSWPQLASAVTMGGGITADIGRRMLLNQFTQSGRYYIDIEELVGNKEETIKEYEGMHFPELNEKEIKKAIATISKTKTNETVISDKLITKWIEDSIKAPSAGNNQPWKWYIDKNDLYLLHDKNKSVGWSDPFDHLAYIGLGACLENLVLSASESGYNATINYFPIEKNVLVVAYVSFSVNKNKPKFQKELYSSINLRCTNRKKGTKESIKKEILNDIKLSVGKEYEILFVEDEKQIDELGEIVSAVEKMRFMNPNGHYEFFKKEIRWTEKEVQETKDGLDIATLELSNLNKTGLKVASNEDVMSMIRGWKGGEGLQKMTRDTVKTSSAVGLIRSIGGVNFVDAGRAVQKAWLMANYHAVSFHPISSPLFFFDRLENKNDLPIDMQEALKFEENHFTEIFSKQNNSTNVFLFRLSKSDAPSAISLRRDVKTVLL